MRPDDDTSTRPVSRRAALAAGGAVGVAGFAAACGSPDTPPPGAPGTPAPLGPPAAGSAGTTLGAATDVPVGGGKVFETLEVVVTQPTAGDYRGFSAICTHTGCIVTTVSDGTINCPCHGSRYRLDGTVAAGPAPRPLRPRPVTVDGGQIVLS